MTTSLFLIIVGTVLAVLSVGPLVLALSLSHGTVLGSKYGLRTGVGLLWAGTGVFMAGVLCHVFG